MGICIVKLDMLNGGVKKLCNMITRFFGLWIFCKGHGHIIISKGTLMVMKVEYIVEKKRQRKAFNTKDVCDITELMICLTQLCGHCYFHLYRQSALQ
jgi:hypothetical protein